MAGLVRSATVTCSAEGCHKDDDAHKGRLGDKCEQCHIETGDNLFNHNTMSAFHLDGKHLTVRCTDCHPSVTFKPRPTTCFGCHPEPAVHKGQYGTQCEQCHTTRMWEDIKPLHDVGDFSLRGMHDNIACERCHRDNRPTACHRPNKPKAPAIISVIWAWPAKAASPSATPAADAQARERRDSER